MKYTIEKPAIEYNDGIFSLLMKYLTYSIVGWFVCWLMLVIVLGGVRQGNSKMIDAILDYPLLISALFALIVAIFLIKRSYDKFRFGELVAIEMTEDLDWIKLELINRQNGKTWLVEILHQDGKIVFKKTENELLGKQRIILFFKKGKMVTRLNVELTAWCRNKAIDEIIKKLHQFNTKKTTQFAQLPGAVDFGHFQKHFL